MYGAEMRSMEEKGEPRACEGAASAKRAHSDLADAQPSTAPSSSSVEDNDQSMIGVLTEHNGSGGKRNWFALFFDSSVRAAVAGAVAMALLTVLLPAVYHHWAGPPDARVVTALMDEEASASMKTVKTQRLVIVRSIYAPGAVVTDAGCQSPAVSSLSWQGIRQIDGRYSSLPRFLVLQHVNDQVNWVPDNRHATEAEVQAQTVGVLQSSPTSRPQFIRGDELWTFELVNGRWLIKSFIYNLCFPTGGEG
jgi:hypothetical protein